MYSFPMLSNAEIVQCLRELDIEVNDGDIPVRAATERLVELCLGVTREDMAGAPELHADSLVEVGLYRSACDMMATCGVKDYGLKDWLGARLRRNLSAVINFVKFREEELVVYTGLCDARDDRAANLSRAQAACDAALTAAAEVAAKTADERQRAADARDDCAALEAAIADLESRTVSSWPARALDAERQCEEAEAALKRTTDALGIPASLVLPDDQLSHGDVARLRALLCDERHACAVAEEQARDAEDILADMTSTDLEDAARAVHDIEAEVAAHKASLKDLKAAQARTQDARAEIVELKRETEGIESKTVAVAHRLSSFQDDTRKLHQDDLDTITSIKEDIAHLETERQRLEAARDDLDARESALQAQLQVRRDLDATDRAWIANAARDLALLLADTSLQQNKQPRTAPAHTSLSFALSPAAKEKVRLRLAFRTP